MKVSVCYWVVSSVLDTIGVVCSVSNMGESTFVAQSPERNVVFRWVAISAVLIITLAALRHGASQQRKSSNASNTNTKVAKSTYEWKVEQAAPKFEGKLEDVYLEMLCGTTPFQLHAQIALNTDQKLTIVAIHGVENGSNMTFWEPSLGTMTSLGRMARLDLPGFGSSKLPLSGADPRVHHRAIARLVEATEALENKNTKILFFARAWSAVPLLQYLEKSSNSKTLRNKVRYTTRKIREKTQHCVVWIVEVPRLIALSCF